MPYYCIFVSFGTYIALKGTFDTNKIPVRLLEPSRQFYYDYESQITLKSPQNFIETPVLKMSLKLSSPD